MRTLLLSVVLALFHSVYAQETGITLKSLSDNPYQEAPTLTEQRLDYIESTLGIFRQDFELTITNFQGVAECVDLSNNEVICRTKVSAHKNAESYRTGLVRRERDRPVGLSVPASARMRSVAMSISYYWLKPGARAIPYAGQLAEYSDISTTYNYDSEQYPRSSVMNISRWVDEDTYVVWVLFVSEDNDPSYAIFDKIRASAGLKNVEGAERLYMLRLVRKTDEELAALEADMAQ